MIQALAFAALVIGATPSRPDVSTLTPAQQKVFEQVASEEFCACDSPLTMGGCLQLKPSCRVVNHVSRIVYLSAQANLDADAILGYLANRVTGPFCASPKTLDTTGAPSQGPSTAPVTLVEFADFRCSHCKQAAPAVKSALKVAGEQVRFVFMPFPIQNHPLALAAAEAAMAAHAQGKFWAMHDGLFAAQARDFSPEVLRDVAQKVGLDLTRFDQEMRDRTYRAVINQFKNRGAAAGIRATPSLFVNGRPYDLDRTLFTLPSRFGMELDRNTGGCR